MLSIMKNIKLILSSLISVITLSIGGYVYLHSEFAIATESEKSFKDLQTEMRKGRLQESINNDRLWIELLEQKVDVSKDNSRKDKLLRQINRLDQQIEVNMNKLE